MNQKNFSHAEAVDRIKEILEKEYGIEGIKEVRKHFEKLIPDLTFMNNEGHLYIVEIGETDADKIIRYQKNSMIYEISWYSKRCELAGFWQRHKGKWMQMVNPIYEDKINILASLNTMIENKKKELKELEDIYFALHKKYFDKLRDLQNKVQNCTGESTDSEIQVGEQRS